VNPTTQDPPTPLSRLESVAVLVCANLVAAEIDPLFFVHHAQIDRLWWLWQHQNIESRVQDYTGSVAVRELEARGKHSEHDRPESGAKLSDMIDLGGLAPPLSVSQIMATKTDVLCYKYKIEA
jgi:tyrosinase